MRRHLCKSHEAASQLLLERQAVAEGLRATTCPKQTAKLVKRLKDADKAVAAQEAEPVEAFECSFCKKSLPIGEHVAVEVANVTAPRGVDAPLIKDYPQAKRPMLYPCRKCAVKYGFVTGKELETGIREGKFLRD